jgi:hypothetical protein
LDADLNVESIAFFIKMGVSPLQLVVNMIAHPRTWSKTTLQSLVMLLKEKGTFIEK